MPWPSCSSNVNWFTKVFSSLTYARWVSWSYAAFARMKLILPWPSNKLVIPRDSCFLDMADRPDLSLPNDSQDEFRFYPDMDERPGGRLILLAGVFLPNLPGILRNPIPRPELNSPVFCFFNSGTKSFSSLANNYLPVLKILNLLGVNNLSGSS